METAYPPPIPAESFSLDLFVTFFLVIVYDCGLLSQDVPFASAYIIASYFLSGDRKSSLSSDVCPLYPAVQPINQSSVPFARRAIVIYSPGSASR